MSPFNPDPQNRYPSPQSDNGQSRDDERVIEAEIIHDGCDDGRGQGPYGHSCRGGYGQEQFRGSRSPWNGGLHFQTIWTSGGSRQAGLAPGITLALIIIAGIQFGLLASIGFMVFHAIGSVLNSMREMRSMLAGNPPNPWPGRILSWTISFLLVGWLSGGFQ